jgi:two-component system response regulator DctR
MSSRLAASTGTVHVVDDEEVVRDALAWLLRSRRLLPEPHVSADAFWAALEGGRVRLDDPACLLLDMRMPGMSGMALFERLLERGCVGTLQVIFLTGHADVATAVTAVKRGAFDFIEKPFSDNSLVDRVIEALGLSATALATAQDRGQVHRLLGELTDREQEVMRLVIQGRANKQIADQLDISVRTVEVHRARVFDKMGVRSAVELTNTLRQAGAA